VQACRDHILACLDEGACIITPNNRLAREISLAYSRKPVQPRPLCLPYSKFLEQCYQAHCLENAHKTLPIVLKQHQLRHLWLSILNQDGNKHLNPGLLDKVAEAFAHCQRFQVDVSDASFDLKPQTRQFQAWFYQCEAALRRLNAITEDELAHFLIAATFRPTQQTLVWTCFEDLSPEQRLLQDYLSSQGAPCINTDLNQTNTQQNISCFTAADEEAEYQQQMVWINERLAKGDKHIGLVVPDLQGKAPLLARMLKRQVAAGHNISLGKPLSSFPIVAHALSFLTLKTTTLNQAEARRLLYSPFLTQAPNEAHQRMQALQDCPVLKEERIDLETLIQAISAKTPLLAKTLSALSPYKEQASLNEWIDCFIERLSQLGFPGGASLNSESYQAYTRFLGLFDEFRALGLISEVLDKKAALDAFKRLADQTIFQAQGAKAAIHILGLLEASGCLFDSLWISGMSNDCLPKATALSPFIPHQLQRQLGMPHTCPKRELAIATSLIERFKKSSAELVFSYPRLSQAGPMMASPLMQGMADYLSPDDDGCVHDGRAALESYTEDYKLALNPQETSLGGSALLANQAKCPFRAFAAHRLHANKAQNLSDGLSLEERGQVIHQLMEVLWKTLKNQQTLLSMSTQALDTLLLTSIQSVLAPYQQLRKHSFSEPVRQVEITRLQRLAQACFAWEKQRPAFEVLDVEKTVTLELAGLSLKLRIDRLDRVGEDAWVIDYKTSLPSPLPWWEERPQSPQLLLYALADETISTLLFVALKKGQIYPKGLSEEKETTLGISGLKKNEHWTGIRQYWQQQITLLAEEYQQGHCPPKPATASICQTCDFQSLCRFRVLGRG